MLGHCCSILCVEVGVDLVKKVERRGITCLNGEDQRQGAQTCTWLAAPPELKKEQLTLLATRQLLDSLLVIVLAVE